jgi:pSer/pThr/pTyr-binding forkhead associated (FHA) protein
MSRIELYQSGEVSVPSSDEQEHQDGKPVVKTAVVDEDTKIRQSRRPSGILVEVVGGPMDGERRHGPSGTLTIGRAQENDLALFVDPSVSTRHARIVIENGQYWLEDLGSTNGTYLGEGRVQGRVLIGPGTVFVVGRTTLELTSR